MKLGFLRCGLWIEMNERERRVEKGNLKEIWRLGEESGEKWKKLE